MKAVHGAKTKNDRKDAHTIASILRGGTFPLAHVYPEQKRPTRDLLRRRTFFVRKRAELLTHIQNTSWQYRLEPIGRRLANRRDRAGVAELFSDESVRASVEADLDLVADYDLVIKRLEQQITKTARIDDARRYDLIRSIPGVGRVLTLVFFYELEGFERFDSVSEFASYSRLIRPKKTSAGKPVGFAANKKMGNGHLKWAFSEATLLLVRESVEVKAHLERLSNRHGKGKALGILTHKLGRTLYYMLQRNQPFDLKRFLQTS
jgi:transposase